MPNEPYYDNRNEAVDGLLVSAYYGFVAEVEEKDYYDHLTYKAWDVEREGWLPETDDRHKEFTVINGVW
jgi:hypothetical protein